MDIIQLPTTSAGKAIFRKETKKKKKGMVLEFRKICQILLEKFTYLLQMSAPSSVKGVNIELDPPYKVLSTVP